MAAAGQAAVVAEVAVGEVVAEAGEAGVVEEEVLGLE